MEENHKTIGDACYVLAIGGLFLYGIKEVGTLVLKIMGKDVNDVEQE